MKSFFLALITTMLMSTGLTAEQKNVVTTTTMLTDLVKNLAGDKVNVQGLMGSGIDPHLYKPRQSDMSKLLNADMIVYNGIHLEGKMSEILEKMKGRKKILAAAEQLDKKVLLADSEGEYAHDPHVWFDVSLWKSVAESVGNFLATSDPDNAAVYRANTNQYVAQLVDLKKEITAEIATLPKEKRVLITAHDAFNYFGHAYGFEVMGIQGISTAAEAGANTMIRLADLIAEKKIPAIFVESSISPRAVEALRKAVRARGYEVVIGGELFSDALGDPGTVEGTYTGMIRHNVHTIVKALGKQP